MAPEFCDSLLRRGRLGNKAHVGLGADDLAEALPKNRMVLDAQNPNGGGGGHRFSSAIVPPNELGPRRQLGTAERGPLAMDLAEVGLVDRETVNLLMFSEGRGIELRNCPAYIGEWVDRERAQHTQDPSEPRT